MSVQDMKALKGVGDQEVPFDRMVAPELSAKEFPMNLAAEATRTEQIRAKTNVMRKIKDPVVRLCKTMVETRSGPPESLPAEEPIKVVERQDKPAKKPSKLPSGQLAIETLTVRLKPPFHLIHHVIHQPASPRLRP